MCSPSHYGEQPAAVVPRERGFTYARLAREIGCTYSHLYNAVQGHTVPSPRLRDQMPAALSTPLSKLFTALRSSDPEYDNRGRPRKTEARAA